MLANVFPLILAVAGAVLAAILTRAIGVNGTPEQRGMGIPTAGGIANDPLPLNEVAIARVGMRHLDVKGNFLELVPPTPKLIAVTAFQYRVGFTLMIHMTAGLRHPI